MTKAIWAMVHGITTLSIAYQTESILANKPSLEAPLETFLSFLLEGIWVTS